jgi:hypothetical protein
MPYDIIPQNGRRSSEDRSSNQKLQACVDRRARRQSPPLWCSSCATLAAPGVHARSLRGVKVRRIGVPRVPPRPGSDCMHGMSCVSRSGPDFGLAEVLRGPNECQSGARRGLWTAAPTPKNLPGKPWSARKPSALPFGGSYWERASDTGPHAAASGVVRVSWYPSRSRRWAR